MSKIWQEITPETWCKGEICQWIGRESLHEACKKSPRCCLTGWIHRVYGTPDDSNNQEVMEITNKLKDMVASLNFPYIVSFNDSPKTTFQDVLELVQKADV